ncbi:MAG TPA: hypothetical protein VLS94_06520 [Fusibacter sp.]|nr:hypothetical protein [Fusibacter sp.]
MNDIDLNENLLTDDSPTLLPHDNQDGLTHWSKIKPLPLHKKFHPLMMKSGYVDTISGRLDGESEDTPKRNFDVIFDRDFCVHKLTAFLSPLGLTKAEIIAFIDQETNIL